jgi:hypothetical protein
VIVSDNPSTPIVPPQHNKPKTKLMNNTLHTPAPWQVSPYGNITSKSGKIASVEQMPGNYESEKQANAHLIAAAPDLLQVVADYVLLCDLHDYVGAVPDAAREALRKAKGEA